MGPETDKQVAKIADEVYSDAIKPWTPEVGKAGLTVLEAINTVLAPLRLTVWGYKQIEDFLTNGLKEKLKDVSPENIQTPKANIFVPALEGLRNVSEEQNLQEMYLNLIAKAMDKSVAKGVMPSFAYIIQQLTSDEAKVFDYIASGKEAPVIDIQLISKDRSKPSYQGYRVFMNHYTLLGSKANCQFPSITPVYLDNLQRLGLINVSMGRQYAEPEVYKELEESKDVREWKALYDREESFEKLSFRRGSVLITDFGIAFYKACKAQTASHSPKRTSK